MWPEPFGKQKMQRGNRPKEQKTKERQTEATGKRKPWKESWTCECDYIEIYVHLLHGNVQHVASFCATSRLQDVCLRFFLGERPANILLLPVVAINLGHTHTYARQLIPDLINCKMLIINKLPQNGNRSGGIIINFIIGYWACAAISSWKKNIYEKKTGYFVAFNTRLLIAGQLE